MVSFDDHRDRVMRSLVPGRLLKGSVVLGRLWAAGTRCEGGWRPSCGCQKRTTFCEAKLRWVDVLEEYEGAKIPDEEFGVILAMTVNQFRFTGLTVVVGFPDGLPPIRFGGRDGAAIQETWPTLFDDDGKPHHEAVKTVARIQAML
jgi:hypothetical protein